MEAKAPITAKQLAMSIAKDFKHLAIVTLPVNAVVVAVTHRKELSQQLFQDKMIPDSSSEEDAAFRATIARSCAEHYKCALCIAAYIQNTWHKDLSQEELVYLTIHLKRVAGGLRPATP